MHNRDRYPAIWAEMEKLREHEAALLAKRKPHIDKVNELYAKIEELAKPIFDEIQAESAKAKADIDEIREVRSGIAACAKAMGGRALSDR